AAPYRLGLTATFERADMRHTLLPPLIGDVVYTVQLQELVGKHVAPFIHEKVTVKLQPEEKKTYDENMRKFRGYIRKHGLTFNSLLDFQKFIMKSGVDPEAREALLARNRALKTALNSQAKLEALTEKLNQHKKEKIIIFTLHNSLVYKVSSLFLIPAITCQTPIQERRLILEMFRAGKISAIVTSQVLDEGVDVPDASVGIILGGTGSRREQIQRLGRLLRMQHKKVARLIEIVAEDTLEERFCMRRRIGGSKHAAK
ncbi:MAG: DEAD/DEAH box helicase, partial [Candidatus Bathyarchaeota archaeon]|nr:DEAD/DEAH box helicase [Candidatus Bathyarchaeota archaeon]